MSQHLKTTKEWEIHCQNLKQNVEKKNAKRNLKQQMKI